MQENLGFLFVIRFFFGCMNDFLIGYYNYKIYYLKAYLKYM